MSEKVKATAQALVENCKAGESTKGLDIYYADDAVSIEAGSMDGGPREFNGLPAIKAKHDHWNSTMDVHEMQVEGPFMHGEDRFSVVFKMDATDTSTNQRWKMQEVGVYHCNDQGQIIHEEFYMPIMG